MTLKSRKVFSAVHMSIIVLSLVSSPLAQAPRARLGLRQVAAQESQQTEEEKRGAKELERKALALIDEVVADAMSLSLAKNRVHILTVASDVLWTRDEERARALVREAMNQAVAYMREAKEKSMRQDAQYFDSENTSHMVLDVLVRRDAKLVLEFLSLTRPLRPGGYEERRLELELASQIVESDPQTALGIAEEHFDDILDGGVIDFWSALLRKDQRAASTLTKRIIGDLKARDILADYGASYALSSVLNVLGPRANESADTRNNQGAADAMRSDSADIQQAYRDALEIVVAAALKVTGAQLQDYFERERAKDLLTKIRKYLPEIEKHLRARAQVARAKLAQFDKALQFPPAAQGSSGERFEDMVENKSADELIAMGAAESQSEPRYWLYLAAVNKLIEQGDSARARQVAKDYLPDHRGWNPLFAEIKLEERAQAMKEGNLEEARKSILQLRSSEERALAWIELATKAEYDKDQKSQQQALNEAGALLGAQIETRSQVEAQLSLAAASLDLDPDRGFEILGSSIDRLNAVVSALGTITKFNQRELKPSGLVIKEEGDELDINLFHQIAPSLSRHLLAFARKDFDRTVVSLKRSQVSELRLATCLTLLNRILGDEPSVY
jgi:hypothetical protein